MAPAAGLDSPSDHRHLRLDSLPLVDLGLLSQSELYSLSLYSSSSQPHGRCDDDVLIPKIDRSVFNESAGSRKQTYSRLRLAPRNSQFASSSSSSAAARQTPEPLAQESFQVIALLKQLFASGNHEELVPIRVDYNDGVPEPSSSAAVVANVPIHVVLPNSAPEKRKRGRPRKKEREGLGTVNWGNPLPISSTAVSYGSVGDVVSTPVLLNSAISVGSEKRKRGRPRKNPIPYATVTGTASVPISLNAAFHHSTTEISSMPVPSKAMSNGSAGDIVDNPVSFNSAFSNGAKKRKPGRPRKNPIAEADNRRQGHRDTVLACNVIGSVPVQDAGSVHIPVSSNADIVSVPVSSNAVFHNSTGNVASGGTLGKRKRGRPRKNENRPVLLVEEKAKAVKACDDAKKRIEEELVSVNRNGDVVDLVALGTSEDPFGMELRRRTEGLKTEAELLGFLGGLEGEWGSWRRKKKIVPATELGDTLPKGWKIQISIKRKEGHVSLFCRRYLSPNGQQFVSCKEVSSYLLASFGVQDAGQSKPGLAGGNVQVANKVGSAEDANLSFEDGKDSSDVPVSGSRMPITFVSTDHGERAICLETRNLQQDRRIETDEEKPSSSEANEKVSSGSFHGKLRADSLTEAFIDRQKADAATCVDRESGGPVSNSHGEKVKNVSKDEKHQEFCGKQEIVCSVTNKNELGELEEAIKVGETASSNINGNNFESSDCTSLIKCIPNSTSMEEPKRNVDPGTALPAASSEDKICSPADCQFTGTVADRNDGSTSSLCGSGDEELVPVNNVNRSLTSIMTGFAHDKSSEPGLCHSSIDEGMRLVISGINNVSSSYESKFPNEKINSSGSNRATSNAAAETSNEHDRSSGRCLNVTPSNEQNFIAMINSDIANFKMEEPWDDRGFVSNVFTSFHNDDNVNKSSFVAVDLSKVNDVRSCKDTGICVNPVSSMEQGGNFRGGSHVSSSNESKYAWRDCLVSNSQTEEVKLGGGSSGFHVLGRPDYSQSCNFIDDANNIFSSSMGESTNKEMSFWSNEVLHAFGSIDTGTDANAGTSTLKERSSEGLSPVISSSGRTFPNTNNVEELELKKHFDIDLTHVPDDAKRVSSSTPWEQPKPEDTDKSRNNELITASVNNSRPYEDITPELIWRTNDQNFQPSGLVDTSSAPVQLSGCFPNFNILSEKDAYGNLNVNETYEGISDLEGLGLGSTEQSQYNFLTAQGTLNSTESKGPSPAETKLGFDSTFWLAKESLTLFPKTGDGHQTVTICIWCRNEFYHQGVSPETKSDSMGLMCATCQAKFSG